MKLKYFNIKFFYMLIPQHVQNVNSSYTNGIN